METIKCDLCIDGKILPAIPNPKISLSKYPDCPDCMGSGKIECEPSWKEVGDQLKTLRMEAKIGIRAFCKRFSLDSFKVSQCERGVRYPDEQITNAYLDIISDVG